MPVLFISHSSKDDIHANVLAAWLRANRFTDFFIDHQQIRADKELFGCAAGTRADGDDEPRPPAAAAAYWGTAAVACRQDSTDAARAADEAMTDTSGRPA
jgi:hypothetical protein